MKIGIGFVTGRKNFRHILKTYINHCQTSNFGQKNNVSLNFFAAYDLKYTGTKISDYKNVDPDDCNRVDSITFIGRNTVLNEIANLVQNGIVTSREARMIFGDGYGKQRNIVTYFAVKNGMDYLLFIDDDEYPVAPIREKDFDVVWKGQDLLKTHLENITGADVTNGYHCGYISPIPYIEYNSTLTEKDLKLFIEALSNDILNWDSIRSKLQNGGITFAERKVIDSPQVEPITETHGAKFISGSNLCLNLRNAEKLPPFYNPPKARGEDTFFSTCLADLTVLRVPCYTFHDGFLSYSSILHGVLPNSLKPVTGTSPQIIMRFLRASIGWARYKPLLLYITKPKNYEEKIEEAAEKLEKTVPKFCQYFHLPEFEMVKDELLNYHQNVRMHFTEFEETRYIWKKVIRFAKETASLEQKRKSMLHPASGEVLKYKVPATHRMSLQKNKATEIV